MNRILRESRLRGAIYGLLVGDALGVPYEFSDSDELPPKDLLEMKWPPGFQRAHSGVPPGTWSDDGAQALHLLKVLLDGDSDLEVRMANGLLSWQGSGSLTPDNQVFDIGFQTLRALELMQCGVPPHLAGPSDHFSNGNGSLMRTLPAGLLLATDDAAYISRARRLSRPTHGHARSMLACSMSTLIGARLLAGLDFVQALDEAQAVLETTTRSDERQELRILLDARLEVPRGTGYVVDCFWSAVAAVLRTSNFEDCVRYAIGFGNDTDTTACVAGGWAGLLYGEKGIPERWMLQLRGKHLVEPMLARLVGDGSTKLSDRPARTGTMHSIAQRLLAMVRR